MPIAAEIWVESLKGKIVFVGIGNPIRGDDGLGPLLVNRLKGLPQCVGIDAGSAPESYAGKIIKEAPDTIILVDAIHLNRSPGETALLSKSDILKSGFTTHDISPHLLIDFLEHETNAAIYLLGVQPSTLQMGAEMSEPVKKSVDELVQQIKEILHA